MKQQIEGIVVQQTTAVDGVRSIFAEGGDPTYTSVEGEYSEIIISTMDGHSYKYPLEKSRPLLVGKAVRITIRVI